jgi:hypothetical protein
MRKPASETYDDMNAQEAAATAFYDPWEEAPPVAFPTGVFRPKIEDTLFSLALRDGVCPGALAMAHLAAVSGAAHKATRFKPYHNSEWDVPPVVWIMLIAMSGQRKTAAQEVAFASLQQIDDEAWQEYRVKLQEWNQRPPQEKKSVPAPAFPAMLTVQDITVEALQTCLAATDRGTLSFHDELAELLDFGRYSQGKGAAERSFYLQSFEGGRYTVIRMSRAPVIINNNALSIYGAIQLERLKEFPGLDKDGFIQRMSIVRSTATELARPDVIVDGHDELQEVIAELGRSPCCTFFFSDPEGEALIRQTEADGKRLRRPPRVR